MRQPHFHLAPLALAALLLAGGAAQAQPAAAPAAIAIAAQPLGQALNELSRQAGVPLLFPPALVAGKSAPAVQGTLTTDQALARLLAGSGLVSAREGGAIVIKAAPVPATAETSATTLAEVRVTAQAVRDGTTEGTGSYTTDQSSYGKGQTLKELPQTVTVMAHERIQEQGMQTLDNVLEYTPGITVDRASSAIAAFYSRGFEITDFQIDGNSPMLSMSSAQVYAGGLNTSQMDLAMFDSVEVLRGSDALYGTSGEPSGAINLVRKKPTKQFQLKGQTSAGSWNNYRGELDVGGPLTADGRVRGRLVGALEDREYFLKNANSNRKLLYGIIEADITNSTMITVGADAMHDDSTNWRFGLPRYSNGQDIGLPRSTFFATDSDRWKRESEKQFIRLDQEIGTNWTLGIEASRAKTKIHQTDPFWTGAIDSIDFSGLTQWVERGVMNERAETQKSLDAVLKGSFHMFGMEHKLVLGANSNQYKVGSVNYRRFGAGVQVPNIFEFNPSDYQFNEPYTLFLEENFLIKQKGVYGSLAAKIANPLTLIVGGRLSRYKYDYILDVFDRDTGAVIYTGLTRYKDNKVFTPYLGLVYDLSNQWTAYASMAETYQSQASSLKAPLPGTPLDPVTGRTYEVGVKGSLFDGRLNTALALYHITRNGQAVEDPAYSYTDGSLGSSCCYLGDGRVVSRGVDIEVGGEIATGWRVQAGYTFNDNQNKADNGRYSTITPKHLFKLWTSYALRGELNGLTIGGGVTAQSSNYRKGSAKAYNSTTGKFDGPSVPYEFTEPGRAVVDLFAQYRFNKHWAVILNVTNVFDKKYYQTVGSSSGGNWYGTPRNFLLTLRGSF